MVKSMSYIFCARFGWDDGQTRFFKYCDGYLFCTRKIVSSSFKLMISWAYYLKQKEKKPLHCT